MSEEYTEKEAVNKVYEYAMQLKNTGASEEEIKRALMDKGLDEESAYAVIRNIRDDKPYATEEEDGSMGWVLWIGALVVINLLSYILDWGFWLY